MNHCAVNAIIYGKGVNRWAMTERSSKAVSRSVDALRIGASQISLRDHSLKIDIDEIAALQPRRLRGQISVSFPSMSNTTYQLDHLGKHFWTPISPRCRVDVSFSHPQMAWTGDGYFDHNHGQEPIDRGFKSWNWSRIALANGDTLVMYDRLLRNSEPDLLTLKFDTNGALISQQQAGAMPEPRLVSHRLPTTSIWRMPRSIRWEPGSSPSLARTLEDTPFYSRSEINGQFAGQAASGIHESVSLDRLTNPIVQLMLPFRMPRRG